RWFTSPTSGTALHTAADGSFNTPIISGTTVYYVAASTGTCESLVRTAVTATINPAPTAIAITETPVSTGGSAACDLDYVKLDIINNNAVTVVQEGFENTALIFTPDYSSTSIFNLSDFYWDASVKTEGT